MKLNLLLSFLILFKNAFAWRAYTCMKQIATSKNGIHQSMPCFAKITNNALSCDEICKQNGAVKMSNSKGSCQITMLADGIINDNLLLFCNNLKNLNYGHFWKKSDMIIKSPKKIITQRRRELDTYTGVGVPFVTYGVKKTCKGDHGHYVGDTKRAADCVNACFAKYPKYKYVEWGRPNGPANLGAKLRCYCHTIKKCIIGFHEGYNIYEISQGILTYAEKTTCVGGKYDKLEQKATAKECVDSCYEKYPDRKYVEYGRRDNPPTRFYCYCRTDVKTCQPKYHQGYNIYMREPTTEDRIKACANKPCDLAKKRDKGDKKWRACERSAGGHWTKDWAKDECENNCHNDQCWTSMDQIPFKILAKKKSCTGHGERFGILASVRDCVDGCFKKYRFSKYVEYGRMDAPFKNTRYYCYCRPHAITLQECKMHIHLGYNIYTRADQENLRLSGLIASEQQVQNVNSFYVRAATVGFGGIIIGMIGFAFLVKRRSNKE